MIRPSMWSVFLIALFCLCCTAKREPKVAEISRRIIPVETVGFAGAYGALIVTGDGALMRTDDGGATWERVPSPVDQPYKSICFIDSLNGWAVVERGDVLHTTDGGRTWARISRLSPPNNSDLLPVHISFVDGLHGCVVDPSWVFLTEDGGINWEAHYPGVPVPNNLFASYFVNPKKGWLIGSGGALFRTDDGGRRWERREIPLMDDVLEITFSNEKVGWISAVGGLNDRGWHDGELYRTHDGGETWQQVALPSADQGITWLHFVGEDEGWAVGSVAETGDTSLRVSREVALHTRDGGKTWDLVRLTDQDEESPYQRVFFADSQHGWITTESKVYRTDDGGMTWRAVLKIASDDKLK